MDPRPGAHKGPFQGQQRRPSPAQMDTDQEAQQTAQKGPFKGQVTQAPEVQDSPTSPEEAQRATRREHRDGGAASAEPAATSSPYERDSAALDRLLKAGGLSTGMAQWMRLFIFARDAAIEGRELSENNRAALYLAERAGIPLPLTARQARVPQRAANSDEARKRARSRSLSLTPPADSRQAPAKKSNQGAPPPPLSFADAAKKNVPAPTPGTSGTSGTPGASKKAPKEKEAPKYPPLVVENLPNWTHHFQAIGKKLGRSPNGRPYGQGIRFSPTDESEYRLIQAYLSDLEKEEGISWFSYSLPAEQSLKVAIRGLPSTTPIEELQTAFQEKGFILEYAKNIKGRQGRPGSIFYALFKKTPELTPGIYNVNEILYMPGVTIEAWRGKKGPQQCHKCQKWRHSSHCCHRQQACVRCGEPHFAKECPRPREEPATCANCGGAHPANYHACPSYKRELRNRKAGTAAQTQDYRGGRKGEAPVERASVQESAAASLMAPARNPSSVPTNEVKKKKKKQKKAAKTTSTEASKISASQDRRGSLGQTIGVLKEILEAVQSGVDPNTATMRSLLKLINAQDQQ